MRNNSIQALGNRGGGGGGRKGMRRSIGHEELPKFHTEIFVEWKALSILFFKQLLSMLSHLSRGLYQQRLNIIVLSTFSV